MLGQIGKKTTSFINDTATTITDAVSEKISDNFSSFLEKNNPNKISKYIEDIGFKIDEIGIYVIPPYLRLNFDILNSNIDMNKLEIMSKNGDIDDTSKFIIKQLYMVFKVQNTISVENKTLTNIEIEIGVGKPNIQLIYK
jgi:hypothetical protein